MKRIIAIATIMLIITSLNGTHAYAQGDDDYHPVLVAPTSTISPLQGNQPDNGITNQPLGTLSKKQIDKCNSYYNNLERNNTNTGKTRSVQLYKALGNYPVWLYDIYYVDSIYSRYDGYYDRGEVARATNYGSLPATLSFAIKRTVSNRFSVSITFDRNRISSALGYDVTWSKEKSWTYSPQVPPGKTAHIGYQDWYHVQKFNCHTIHIYEDYPDGIYGETEYGNGWGSQWYMPGFYNWET